MTEENSWIDFSNVTPWEETISALEDIFASFHIGIQAAEKEDQIYHKDADFTFDGVRYIVSYYYSSYACQWKEEHASWPVYMVEMMDVDSVHSFNKNSIFDAFGISEYILIHLDNSYIDLKLSKQVLSSAVLAMRSQEYCVPIFVECHPNRIPFIGYAGTPYGENGHVTLFRSEWNKTCPDYCMNMGSMINWLSSQVHADPGSIVISRSYNWIWFPSTTQSQWRFHVLDKQEVSMKQPVLFMLQGFSSVPMWGPIRNPLAGIDITADMPSTSYKDFSSFDAMKANHFRINARFSDMDRLPLTGIFRSLCSCWNEAVKAGPKYVLFTAGRVQYNQLLQEEDRNAKGGNFVITSMMDLITGNRAVSVEAIVDAVKYIFKKGIQVNDEERVDDISRRVFVPSEYLDHIIQEPIPNDEEATPISLPERVITIPNGDKQEKWILPEVNGSYHIPRQILPKDKYNWVSHSAPPNSLVTLMSLRCGEIVNDQPLETLSLFWYLFVTVIETHYEHHKLLPHLGCISDSFDNISYSRPPLPTFQYNLLHQKLTLLNCCIEEQLNNENAEDIFATDSDSPLYYSDDEKEVEEQFHKPEGKGILNWSGWFLTGTSIPCWIPITKDKTILTEDKVKQQQELLAKAGSAVNEIRDEFVDTVADDIQAFKAANPQAKFEDFVRWHSPRDWSEKEGEVMGELSSRMQGNNPLRTLFDELKGVPAKQQKQFFNADFEAELVLDYLRTLSPLTAMQNLLSPFLEATAYIFDHVDEMILEMEEYQKEIQELKSVIKQISHLIDTSGEVSESILEACCDLLMRTETIASQLSCLLEITKGDKKVVNEWMKAHGEESTNYNIDLVNDLSDHRGAFVDLIQDQLDKGEADSSICKLYAVSAQSSEERSIVNQVEPSGHRLCVDKNDNRVIVTTAISSCDIMT